MSSILQKRSPDSRAIRSAIRTGQQCFPWRIAVGAIAVVFGGFIIHPRNIFGAFAPAAGAVSLICIALGLALRAWGAACAGDHTRSGQIEAPRLVTGGPYAFVRNPIYLGSFVLGLGVIGLFGDPWLLVPHAVVFGVFFGMIVPAEEQFLMARFGEDYARFCRAVPKFVPRLNRWKEAVDPPHCWRAARGEAVIGLVVLLIYGVFRAILLVRR
ncbi:MAG TPA: isoprenylcysteine carboxylmethyltransferase family protein [Chthoniobacteraceae bacterium]|nr:isoprenylcysteine carboxylmethyltransferase family protein [Chthoniobacteraceae bacterium]